MPLIAKKKAASEYTRYYNQYATDLISRVNHIYCVCQLCAEYTELVGEEMLIRDIKDYIKTVIKLLKSADYVLQPVTMGLFLEYLSERVCSTHRASSFIKLLQHTYAQHIAATLSQ